MKAGSTFIVVINSDVETEKIEKVEKIIFTLKGAETIVKNYPDEVNFSDGSFFIPLTQEDTLALAKEDGVTNGRKVFIEGQFNFKDKSVLKSEIKSFFISSTLATEIVEGNTPTQYDIADIKFSVDGDIIVAQVDVEGLDAKIEAEVKKYVGDIEKTLSDLDKKVESKVEKVEGKSLISDEEIERLSKVDNYNDTEVKKSIADLDDNKVDKEPGKSLVADTEIKRLKDVHNYDDAQVKKDITDLKNDKVDKRDGYSLVSDAEKQTWNGKSDFSGDYNDLENKPDPSSFGTKVEANPSVTEESPVLGSLKVGETSYRVPQGGSGGGDVTSVNGKVGVVVLNAKDVKALPEDTELFDGDYNSLKNKPTLFSGDYNDLENKPTLFDGNYNNLINKPTIPSNLSELESDADHRTVTDEQIDKWNQGGGGSSEAKDITMNPTSIIPTTDLQSAIDYMSGVSPFNFEGVVEQKQYTICENPAFEVIFTNAINVNALSKCRMNGRTYRGVPYKEQIFWKYIYDSCDYTIEQLDDNDNVVATYRVQYFPQNDHLMKVTVLDAKTPFVISEEGKHLASANPEIEGTEEELTSIQIGSEKFKIPSGGSSDAHDITYRDTTVEAALDNVGESQGRNKMPFPYKMGMNYVDSGITFDVDNDGTIHVSGTVSNYTTFDFVKKRGDYELLPGTYTVSGGISNDIYLRVQNVTTSTDVTIGTDTGNGATFTLTEKSKIYIYLQIRNNVTVDTVIYPMLELGSVSHGFEPPAESNMALKNELDTVLTDEWTQRTYETGEYAIDGNRLWKCLVTNSERPSEGANWHQVTVMSEVNSGLTALNSKLDSNEFKLGIYGDTIIETKNDYRIIFRTKSNDDKITKSSIEVTNQDSSEVVWSLPIIKQKNFSGTTSASGAVLHNCGNVIIIGAQTNDGKVCTVRGDGYLSVYNPTANGLETLKNTAVSGIVYYIEK